MELFGQRVDPFLSSSELDLFNNQAELKFSVIEKKKSDDEYATDVSDGGTDGGSVDDSYHQKIISTAAADATNEVLVVSEAEKIDFEEESMENV
eukprot:CAMPEP_0206382478 /NCGR_PEP_ID=MMETSP0294-20121207/13296_1 /ASSEMBLY_ACC=CAM_ASM_000327 /TAXON_ID=39354 /ORGANISM="Heterosigma akashiwo, Strain CCMP2393" /LENGTH=93 /DNA_ID=CAMNT_0053832191 /DNA_START=709 /DNA_END=990 /DNA_ORIENTATION=+